MNPATPCFSRCPLVVVLLLLLPLLLSACVKDFSLSAIMKPCTFLTSSQVRVGHREKVCYYDDRIQAGADVTFAVTGWGMAKEGDGGGGAGREWEEEELSVEDSAGPPTPRRPRAGAQNFFCSSFSFNSRVSHTNQCCYTTGSWRASSSGPA